MSQVLSIGRVINEMGIEEFTKGNDKKIIEYHNLSNLINHINDDTLKKYYVNFFIKNINIFINNLDIEKLLTLLQYINDKKVLFDLIIIILLHIPIDKKNSHSFNIIIEKVKKLNLIHNFSWDRDYFIVYNVIYKLITLSADWTFFLKITEENVFFFSSSLFFQQKGF